MITLYGTAQSRAARCAWMLEELGVAYRHVPTSFKGECRTPEFLAINPNGHIPALRDGDEIYWESLAINLYLAEKYGKPGFWPATAEARGHVYQWSFWAITEVEPLLITLLTQLVFLPEDRRDPKVAENARKKLDTPCQILEERLAKSAYLLGDAFSAADLNVASVFRLGSVVKLDLSTYPQLSRWLAECRARPSHGKLKAMP